MLFAYSWNTQTQATRRRDTSWATLPYLIDGPHKITQSNAILRYIARKHNLCGETEEEKIRVDILENQAMDVSNELARVCYSPDFEKLKGEYLEQLPGMMKLFSQFLGKQTWFVGEKITFVDFLAYDILDLHRIFEPKCLDAFPNLKDFVARFEVHQYSVPPGSGKVSVPLLRSGNVKLARIPYPLKISAAVELGWGCCWLPAPQGSRWRLQPGL
uniref:glutathione S-transferase Mu 4 isoform X5 n=1 Tax=Myodes glareolus TaxID=447135 RepID=UPI002020D136|nr:glutathione S-transferase Mu 4 isoform X5 [Myodes glareolus]